MTLTADQVDRIDDLADAIMDLPKEDILTIINNSRQGLNDEEMAHLAFRLPHITIPSV